MVSECGKHPLSIFIHWVMKGKGIAQCASERALQTKYNTVPQDGQVSLVLHLLVFHYISLVTLHHRYTESTKISKFRKYAEFFTTKAGNNTHKDYAALAGKFA
jgi:hypothetical protein